MWLVTFNATKTKLITFHHHRNNPDFPQIAMDGTYLNESTCLNKLLGLKFTPDLKWNAYIDSVAKDAARMVGSLYRSMRLLTPESLLYLYKSQIRPRMEYCSHIWAGSSRTILSTLDRVQRRMRGLVGETLFRHCNHSPTAAMLQVYHFSIVTFMESVQTSSICWFHQSGIFQSGLASRSPARPILTSWKSQPLGASSTQTAFSPELQQCGIHFLPSAFHLNIISTFSNPG